MLGIDKNILMPGLGFLAFHQSGHTSIVMGQMLLLVISLVILVATLSRFFINFRKCSSAFRNAESIPLAN